MAKTPTNDIRFLPTFIMPPNTNRRPPGYEHSSLQYPLVVFIFNSEISQHEHWCPQCRHGSFFVALQMCFTKVVSPPASSTDTSLTCSVAELGFATFEIFCMPYDATQKPRLLRRKFATECDVTKISPLPLMKSSESTCPLFPNRRGTRRNRCPSAHE